MAQTETATLGGGCFWCVEAVYQRVKGVLSVKPGYAGGHVKNPTYKEICTGQTGHAEVAQIEFDPAQVTYEQILNVFWQAHDPTTLNRQGTIRVPSTDPWYFITLITRNKLLKNLKMVQMNPTTGRTRL